MQKFRVWVTILGHMSRHREEPGDLVSMHTSDDAKSKLLMSNFRINYCN